MSVNLSIKNVPEELAARLRRRAVRAHRSLQGELLAILEEAGTSESNMTVSEVLGQVRARKIRTRAESASILRRDRDAR